MSEQIDLEQLPHCRNGRFRGGGGRGSGESRAFLATEGTNSTLDVVEFKVAFCASNLVASYVPGSQHSIIFITAGPRCRGIERGPTPPSKAGNPIFFEFEWMNKVA